ncbi:hypothetical protein WR25_12932 [Diploscapter pachys]|uniref:Transmembrane protein n=1 Tax=Diploscapter pachys TaxID=2018661 RepID=A0A2A2LXM5_9BILA|nr:hypothetical protein WR25_12932 [Diploscapter pachys]
MNTYSGFSENRRRTVTVLGVFLLLLFQCLVLCSLLTGLSLLGSLPCHRHSPLHLILFISVSFIILLILLSPPSITGIHEVLLLFLVLVLHDGRVQFTLPVSIHSLGLFLFIIITIRLVLFIFLWLLLETPLKPVDLLIEAERSSGRGRFWGEAEGEEDEELMGDERSAGLGGECGSGIGGVVF